MFRPGDYQLDFENTYWCDTCGTYNNELQPAVYVGSYGKHRYTYFVCQKHFELSTGSTQFISLKDLKREHERFLAWEVYNRRLQAQKKARAKEDAQVEATEAAEYHISAARRLLRENTTG